MPDEDKSKGGGNQDIVKAIQQMLTGVGQMAGVGQQQPQGGTVAPGHIQPGPPPNIAFSPGGPSGTMMAHGPIPGATEIPMTGSQSIGDFRNRNQATNAGLVSLGNSLSGLFSAVGKKQHDKKAAMADHYMTQIAGFLATGNPEDRKKAEMFLEDPKIKKMLETGLSYKPLEEPAPPEAQGVASAVDKIKQGMGGQGGQQQQQPQRMRPAFPSATPQQQFQNAVTNALLDKIRKDPASALQMAGVSTLSSADLHAAEFFEKGLGLSPAQTAAMTSAEKLAGLKLYETVSRDAFKAQVELYKADKGAAVKLDVARIIAATRDRYTDAVTKNKDKKGAAAIMAIGAKVYADISKQYMDIVKSGKTGQGVPLSDKEKKYYESQAQEYQQKADELLNQQGDQDLWDAFRKAVELGGGDEPEAPAAPEEKEE